MKRVFALLLLCLLFLSGCGVESATPDFPTQPLTEVEQTALNILKDTGILPSYSLQGALKLPDGRVVYGFVHADNGKYVPSAGAEFLGETVRRSSRLTTPHSSLQTDFIPNGYRCYKGEYEGKEAYYFSKQLPYGAFDRLVLTVESELPPEYFDNTKATALEFFTREIPYDDMPETDASFIRSLHNGLTIDGGSPLQRALKTPDACLYIYPSVFAAVEKPPEDTRYVGDTISPCDAYTTPTQVLQTDFHPFGYQVYLGKYIIPNDPAARSIDAVYIEQESGFYRVYIIQSETAPVYFDDGRWMVLLTPEQQRLAIPY